MDTIEVNLFQVDYLWHHIFTPESPDFEEDVSEEEEEAIGGEGSIMELVHNFDYATLPDNKCEFYSDVTIRFPMVAAVCMRSQFRVEAQAFDWDIFFTKENIRDVLSTAIVNTLKGLRDICQQNGVALPPEINTPSPMVTEEMLLPIIEDTVRIYFEMRKPNYLSNYPMQETIQLKCAPTRDSILVFNIVFFVLDEVLFKNRSFRWKHNQDVFFKQVPEMKYTSLKMKCQKIMHEEVQLTQMDVTFFIRCLQCTVQLLLGDKGDSFFPALEEKNVNSELQKVFFKNADQLINMFPHNPEIDEPQVDWDKEIR